MKGECEAELDSQRLTYTASSLTDLNRPPWVFVETRHKWNGQECLFLLYLPHDSVGPKSDSVLCNNSNRASQPKAGAVQWLLHLGIDLVEDAWPLRVSPPQEGYRRPKWDDLPELGRPGCLYHTHPWGKLQRAVLALRKVGLCPGCPGKCCNPDQRPCLRKNGFSLSSGRSLRKKWEY